MGVRTLLFDLRTAGLTVSEDGGQLLVTPRSRLSDDMRAMIKANRDALLAELRLPDALPLPLPWSGHEIALFGARVTLFINRGQSPADAEALAERCCDRDRDCSGLRFCLECSELGGGHCGSWRAAGYLRREAVLSTTPQRCPGFALAPPLARVEGETGGHP